MGAENNVDGTRKCSRFLSQAAIFVASIALLAICMPAAGQDLQIQPVEMRAALVDQQVSAKGTLRLVPAKDLSLTLLAGDLRTTAGETIPGNTVSLPGDVTLKKGQPKDLLIQIDGIHHEGTYEGDFDLYVVDPQQRDEPVAHKTVHVKVRIEAVPKLALVGSQPVMWTVVHCTSRPSCWFTDILLPGAMQGSQRKMAVDDQRNTMPALDGQLLTTAPNGTDAKATMIVERDEKVTRGNQYSAVATFTRSDLVPGAYPAVVKLIPRDRGDALSQPITIDVRSGPLAALLAIAIGVLVGRLSQALATPLFQFQSGLFGRVYQLRSAAEEIADTTLRNAVLGRLDDAIERIDLASAPDTTITSEVETIADRIRASRRLERVMALAAQVDPVKQKEFALRATKIREMILGGKVADATTELDDAETALNAPPPTAVSFGMQGRARPQAEAKSSRPPWYMRALHTLAGTRGPVPAKFEYAVVRPALFLLLLIILCLTGFNTLYVKAPAGFGSAGLFDYLGLFMWGLTADVAQSTLQRLPK